MGITRIGSNRKKVTNETSYSGAEHRSEIAALLAEIAETRDRLQMAETAVFTMSRDITVRNQAEMALQKANDELEMKAQERTARLKERTEQLQSKIAEQQRSESQLKASDEGFRSLFEKAPLAISINRNGRTLFANQAYVDIHGYENSSELIGTQVINQIAPGYLHEISIKMQQLEKREAILLSHETVGLRKDGSTFPCFVQANNIVLPDGPANVAFITDISERKEAETARLRQVDAQAHLLEISKNFANIVVEDIDDVIHTTLRMIGEYGHNDHSCICLFSEDQSTMSNTHEWWAEGVAAGMDSAPEFPASNFPWWNEKTQSSEFIHIPRVADLPPEAQALKEFLHAHSIQSLLIVPMCLEDKIVGFLGVASVSSAKTWSEDNISVLETVAQIISKALLRKKNSQALRDLESYYRTIFENTGAATLIIEEDMTISLANQGCESMFGYKKGALEGTQWTEIASEDMLDTMEEYHRLRRIDPASAPKLYISRIKDYNGKLRDGLVCADVIPGTNKSVATFIDLTDYKRIERALQAICAGNNVMIHSENEQDLLDGICQKIVHVGAYSLAWVGYVQEDQQKKVKPVAHDGKNYGYLNKLNIALKDPKRGWGPVARAIRTGHPQVLKDFKKDDTFTPWLKDALRRGFKSCMAIPLMVDNKALGALSIYSSETDRFDNEEEKLLIEMASELAYAIMSLRTHIEKNQTAQELKMSLEKMRRILMQSVTSLGATLDTRDPYTAEHQRRVAHLATAIAEQMGLSKDQIEGITVAGNLHDIGKINVPSEILSKPGKLSDLEFAIIKNHPQAGYEIVRNIEFSEPVAEIILQHHERMNGSGYPQGLAGDEILMEARIMAVADVVEAMASHRPYRPALGIDIALEEIEQNKDILYDPDVAEACLKLFRRKGFKLE